MDYRGNSGQLQAISLVGSPSMGIQARSGGSSFSAMNVDAWKSALTSKTVTFAAAIALRISFRHS
jgi:hypothetical protein